LQKNFYFPEIDDGQEILFYSLCILTEILRNNGLTLRIFCLELSDFLSANLLEVSQRK
jgi:hypothetical protein